MDPFVDWRPIALRFVWAIDQRFQSSHMASKGPARYAGPRLFGAPVDCLADESYFTDYCRDAGRLCSRAGDAHFERLVLPVRLARSSGTWSGHEFVDLFRRPGWNLGRADRVLHPTDS